MKWWPFAYAISGVLLTLWICYEEKRGEKHLTINDVLMSVLFGWFVGVPVFVLLLVCFGNWPVIARDSWAFLCWPVRAYRQRKGGKQCES